MTPRKIVTGVAALLGLALVFTFMAGGFAEKLPEQLLDRPLQTSNDPVAIVFKHPLPIEYAYTGTVVARVQAELSSRMTARVEEVLVEVGGKVRRGDILIRLDNEDLDARVRQQQQGLVAAQAQLNEIRLENRRTRALFSRQLSSQAELEKSSAALVSAEANLQQQIAAVREVKTSFGYSVIAAPFDGVIQSKAVNPGDTATPGKMLLSLYDPLQLQLQVPVPESQLGLVESGQESPVWFDALHRSLQGTVTEIAPAALGSSRSFLIKVDLESGHKIFPGMFGRLTVGGGTRLTLMVPGQAVETIGQLQYVTVATEQGDERRLIRTGKRRGDLLTVLSGLSDGEKVRIL